MQCSACKKEIQHDFYRDPYTNEIKCFKCMYSNPLSPASFPESPPPIDYTRKLIEALYRIEVEQIAKEFEDYFMKNLKIETTLESYFQGEI